MNEALEEIVSKINSLYSEDLRYAIEASHLKTHGHNYARSNVSNLAHCQANMMQT